MADVNDLLVRIDATTEELRRQLKAAEGAVGSSTAKMDRSLAKVDNAFTRASKAASRARAAFGAVVSVLAVRQVASYVTSIIDIAGNLGEISAAAGITAEQLQRLQVAMSKISTATESQVNKGLETFNRKLGEARTKGGDAAAAFRTLGVSLDMETGPALEATIAALAKIDDAATRASLAGRVVGERFGPKLAGALADGGRQLNRMRDTAKVFTNEQVEAADKLADLFVDIKRNITVESGEAILKNAEAIETLANAISVAVGASIGGVAAVTDFVKWLGEELAAKIHGIAVDDLPRLTAELAKQKRILETTTYSAPRFREGQERIVADLEARIELARRLQSMRPPAGTKSDAVGTTGTAGSAPIGKIDTQPMEHFLDSIEAETEVLKKYAEAIDDLRNTAAEDIQKAVDSETKLRDEALQHFLDNIDAEGKAIDELMEKANENAEEIRTTIEANIGGAIEDMFASGKISASNFFEALLRDLARVAVQLYIIKPLIEGLFGEKGGGSGGGVVGAIRGALGFAKGGEFTVGGSGGPDSQFVPLRLTPGEHVAITPPGKSAGNVVSITQNIDASGSDPAMVYRAARLAKEQAKAEIADLLRRGRV